MITGKQQINYTANIYSFLLCPVSTVVLLYGLHLHSVRWQNVFFNLVLTKRNVHVEFDLMLSVHSLGLDI